ncbi:hypothetical protein ACH47Z_28670 [Streptomyces sp. NPDC020192]|uniref:hypothetical protein n=1 Tax=Streptomyces sp. NPDC020192 TaxID=3365066 RepID=UPI0037898182
MGADGVLQVHLTRYIPDPPDDIDPEPDTLDLHLWAIDPPVWEAHQSSMFPRYQIEETERRRTSPAQYEIARRADAIVTLAHDRPPLLVLDEKMRQYPFASVISVQTERREGLASCLVGLRTRFSRYVEPGAKKPCDAAGFAVTMTATTKDSQPVPLYASALLGWSRWWTANAAALSDREHSLEELPPPPMHLDITEAWRTFRIDLSEPEHTKWPTVPPRLNGWREQCGMS